MITRSKWESESKPGLASDEIPADAITADLRTKGNTLSFWKCGRATDSEVTSAVLAIAAGRQSLQKLDIVWIPQEELTRWGHQMVSTPGTTPFTEMVDRHVDVCHLDYHRLGQIGDQVAVAIRQRRCKRFAQQAVLDLLVDRFHGGRVSEEGLTKKLRTTILNAL
ncbi:MAG: hypothetical protein OXQ32_01775 [bacterium]|nr:hypothetical protein [bacterium]